MQNKFFAPNLLCAVLFLGVSLDAQYVVDQDLGTLTTTATLQIVADTAENLPGSPARNEASYHEGVTLSGNVWGNERVFQFAVTEPVVLSLESVAIGGDPDFILLNDLGVEFDPDTGKDVATGAIDAVFLDGAAPETERFFGGFLPGTYYLVVENYDGSDATVNEPGYTPTNSTCTVDLSAIPALPVDFRVGLGVIAGEGSPLALDSLGSSIDTTMALFDSDGVLIQENDDVSGAVTQSSLDLSAGLSEGLYFVAIGGKGADYSGGLFSMTAGPTEEGAITLNYSLGEIFLPEALEDSLDLTFPATSIQVYSFLVGPSNPGTFTTLGQVALEDEAVSFDLFNSDFDTQLGLFDNQGFLIDFNDDEDFENDIYTSFLSYSEGLPAGTYYLGIGGYFNSYSDGFSIEPDLQFMNDSGSFQLDYNGQSAFGAIAENEQVFYQFSIGSNVPISDVIEVLSVTVSGDQLTLEWVAQSGAVYQVFGSTSGESFSLVPGQDAILTNTTTFTIDTSGEPVKLFQIREVTPS